MLKSASETSNAAASEAANSNGVIPRFITRVIRFMPPPLSGNDFRAHYQHPQQIYILAEMNLFPLRGSIARLPIR